MHSSRPRLRRISRSQPHSPAGARQGPSASAATSLLHEAHHDSGACCSRRAHGDPRISRSACGEDDSDIDSGQQVFAAQYPMCHDNDAAGMMGMHPSLLRPIKRLSRQDVEVAFRPGRATRPPMPAWEGRLTENEINDVNAAFIATLPDGRRNVGPDRGPA